MYIRLKPGNHISALDRRMAIKPCSDLKGPVGPVLLPEELSSGNMAPDFINRLSDNYL